MTRAPAVPKPSRTPARPRSKPTPPGAVLQALEALRAEVAELRLDVSRQSDAVAGARLEEIPRAEDFQPLADHLYAFAQAAPALLESLEATRLAAERVERASRSLAEVADTLVATHESWTESLMRLPRAEDYEPLAAPLREFARVSPALAETLASVVRAVTPLPGLVGSLRPAPAPPDVRHQRARATLSATLERLAGARGVLQDALRTLPRDPTYAAAANHLRELATVSPSLMEWMRQLPALSLPLGESIAGLEGVVRELEEAEQDVRRALESE